ncbi:hypothetical protein GVN24_33390 [Rhizobium sp. CRIBSB]|nr:hypothetical protein [Rhizobium sp. CRIBSB]
MVKKVKKKPKKLSPEEKARLNTQRRHKREIREVFSMAGFNRVDGASDVEFEYKALQTDFDDIFVLENVIVLVEYTITKSSEISGHLKPKGNIYNRIKSNAAEFVAFARGEPLNINSSLKSDYDDHHFHVVILYCSLNTVDPSLKAGISDALYMDYSLVRYFRLLGKTIRRSSRNELLDFLGVPYGSFSEKATTSNPTSRDPFAGSVLPEAQSKFPKGYKVVSFYMHPGALLSRAFVLRRDGWRDRGGVYQRMIIRKKIDDIRRHLVEKERVFVNNVIVTLPSSTKLLDATENTIDPATITKTQPATVSIPLDFNSVGIIDGQHRIFSYFEGGSSEEKIAKLRIQQNLLVTGIVYPDAATPEERTRFEAGLFLEINSTQANAKSDLKQAINQIVRPFIADSIARDTLDQLNASGPLAGIFEQHFFETDKVKTTSVVSYGLRPLVRPTAGGPLFERWTDSAKSYFITAEDDAARIRYVKFCAGQIAIFIGAARSRLPSDKWTAERQVTDRLLTPTIINGFIGSFRQALDNGIVVNFDNIRDRFEGLEKFNFGKYRSSQYTVMSTDLFEKFLK